MSYYPDLSRFSYIEDRGPHILNVGWLEADHDYPTGALPTHVIGALEQLLLHGWQPATAAGWHDCSLCGHGPSDPPIMRELDGKLRLLGVPNLFVPFDDGMFVAPGLVIHYIEAHQYRPPAEFVAALAAIEPGSEAYIRACEEQWARQTPNGG